MSELAKILMIGVRRVQQLAKEGIIPKTEKGRYALIPAVQGYVRFLQEHSMSTNSVPADYRKEKARLTKAQAEIAEIELAQKRGELAPVADFEKATQSHHAYHPDQHDEHSAASRYPIAWRNR